MQGYDTLGIASYLKYSAVGLDLSSYAVKVATELSLQSLISLTSIFKY